MKTTWVEKIKPSTIIMGKTFQGFIWRRFNQLKINAMVRFLGAKETGCRSLVVGISMSVAFTVQPILTY